MSNVMQTSQALNLAGVHNFRDLGGMKTTNGRTIKHGLLFRSADLTDATTEDKQLFQDLGIRTIFDYRTAQEANDRPDPQLPNVNYHRVAVNKETGEASCQSLEDLFAKEQPDSFGTDLLVALYHNLPIGNYSFQQLMAHVKQPADNLPLIQHCAGGRDRTGIGTMIILLALGVAWEDIVEDFLYSNVLLEDYHQQIFTQLEDKIPPSQLEPFKKGFLLQEQYLTLSYQAILAHYATIEEFLTQEYGITADIRMTLQDYCLE
ncbi:tyrosine-protein phosphatase [Gracilibacillus phocaeensis]|uniref:tyrosine-protein phosphatase n=1 Tax=Gracilibacillus phocaeensis TaxID=2042304 RepID=UPI002570545C|nr:tyrosine-protein phosphatase [Gracilibacillus phocaeensis]